MINKEAIEKIKKTGISIGIKKQSPKGSQIVIRNAQLAFVRMAEPYVSDDGKAVYSVTVLFSKTNKKLIEEFMSLIKVTIEKAGNLDAAQKKALAAKVLKIHADGSLLKDGDKILDKNTSKPYPTLAGHLTMQVKCNGEPVEGGTYKPKFDLTLRRAKDKSEIRKHEIADEIYSGVWADIQCQLTPMLYMNKPSLPCYLQGIQKLLDDEKMGGGNAFDDRSDEFAETETDDFSNGSF